MENSSKPPRFLNLQPYKGSSIDIIIGIDVGTTFSGVSYAFLRPGEVPEVQTVTKFTDQTTGDSKIPSIMYYDQSLRLKAAGATAVTESAINDAEFEGWMKIEYFKMNLKPANMNINTHGLKLGSLPPAMTTTKVIGDFLRYLYEETIKYIKVSHTDGEDLLREVGGRETFVLSHPNGWVGLPQQRMREAAISGGLIGGSASEGSRVRFVSEGEASALACLAGGLCPSDLQPGYRFIIADAGGGTLDITSYEVTGTSPLRLKELTSSDCRFAGSVFINIKARELLQKRLRGSQYDNPEILDDIINDTFENTTKRQFSDASKLSWLKVGKRTENNTMLGIRNGTLRLDGSELALCFKFSVDEALSSIRHQLEACGRKSMPVWLVGGFGSSPWLFKQLKEGLEQDGICVSRPDITLSKAVANGNVQFALENTVITRVTRASYGVRCNVAFSPLLSGHKERENLKFKDADGRWKLPGEFSVIIKKNTEVHESDHIDEEYFRLVSSQGKTSPSRTALYCYYGELPEPKWTNGTEGTGKVRQACLIEADLSSLCQPAFQMVNKDTGAKYWKIFYRIELLFGLTELKARYSWIDNGERKYGPASVIYITA